MAGGFDALGLMLNRAKTEVARNSIRLLPDNVRKFAKVVVELLSQLNNAVTQFGEDVVKKLVTGLASVAGDDGEHPPLHAAARFIFGGGVGGQHGIADGV